MQSRPPDNDDAETQDSEAASSDEASYALSEEERAKLGIDGIDAWEPSLLRFLLNALGGPDRDQNC